MLNVLSHGRPHPFRLLARCVEDQRLVSALVAKRQFAVGYLVGLGLTEQCQVRALGSNLLDPCPSAGREQQSSISKI